MAWAALENEGWRIVLESEEELGSIKVRHSASEHLQVLEEHSTIPDCCDVGTWLSDHPPL